MKKILLSTLILSVSATMFAASTAMIRLDIISDANADSNDKVLLVENADYSAGRDQSGDIQKPAMPTANPAASVQIFALTGFADYARAGQLATNNLNDTPIGFTTNTADENYSIKVVNAVFESGVQYYLLDKKLGAIMEIVKDAVYQFTAPKGTTIENRFVIRNNQAQSVCFRYNELQVLGYAGKSLIVKDKNGTEIVNIPSLGVAYFKDLSDKHGRLIVVLDGKEIQIDATPDVTPAN